MNSQTTAIISVNKKINSSPKGEAYFNYAQITSLKLIDITKTAQSS